MMSNPTDSERLYVVETKLDTVLTTVEKTNSKINDLTTSLSRYATRAELEAAVIERDRLIAELRREDAKLAKRHQFNVWMAGVMSMAFGVGLTTLINIALKQ